MAAEPAEGIINNDISLERAAIFSGISLFLVLLGGISSGLNVSLLSMDAKKSKLMIKLSQKDGASVSDLQLKMMKRLQPLIEDRHLLLVTLLVANATCMEALPIFLDELVASWLAVIISVSFVLVFGEIFPQALFTSKPLKSGYKMYYIVIVMKWVFYPICRPLAYLLDCMFGKEHHSKGVVFSSDEVSLILNEIQKHPDEKTVVEGAFKIADYKASDSLIEWSEVTCLNANTRLDATGLLKIYKTGLSRIPIYEGTRQNIIGLLLVKSLILCDPDPDVTIKEYLLENFRKIAKPAIVFPDTYLYDCINTFQREKTHFAMVCDEDREVDVLDCWRNSKPIPDHVHWHGIITLEDIMEDIIQEELIDEFDLQAFQPSVPRLDVDADVLPVNAKADDAKSNWTDDQSFVESVKSRFNAKNKRTVRAKEAKARHSKFFENSEDVDVPLVFGQGVTVLDPFLAPAERSASGRTSGRASGRSSGGGRLKGYGAMAPDPAIN